MNLTTLLVSINFSVWVCKSIIMHKCNVFFKHNQRQCILACTYRIVDTEPFVLFDDAVRVLIVFREAFR